MFKSTAKIIKNQGERIIKLEDEKETYRNGNLYLNKKCHDLQEKLENIVDERKEELQTIANHLTRNDYGNPRAKIAIALEFIENKIKELDNAGNID